MAVRVVILALCVAAVVVLADRRADASACHTARSAVLVQTVQRNVSMEDVERVRDRCDDPDAVAVTAAGLAQADPQAAAGLARVAVDRAPDAFSSWAALATALDRTGDEAGARLATARALQLNPRWTPPRAARPAGGDGAP